MTEVLWVMNYSPGRKVKRHQAKLLASLGELDERLDRLEVKVDAVQAMLTTKAGEDEPKGVGA